MNNMNARYVPSKAGDRMRARKRAPVSAIRRIVRNRISNTVMIMSDSAVAIRVTMVIMKNENPMNVITGNRLSMEKAATNVDDKGCVVNHPTE